MMDTTELRQVLHDDAYSTAFAPMDPDAIIGLARRRRRTRTAVGALIAAGLVGGAVAAAVSTAGATSGGRATLIPAAPPSSPAIQPRVHGIKQPIFVTDKFLRLDPGGDPPTSTASYAHLLAASSSLNLPAGEQSVKVLYGLYTDNEYGYYPSKKLGVGPMIRYFVRKPVVWIIRTAEVQPDGPTSQQQTPTVLTVEDPITAKPLIIEGMNVPGIGYATSSPSPFNPDTVGIVDRFTGDAGSASWFSEVNSWSNPMAFEPTIVYAGGKPLHATSTQGRHTVASILAITPAQHDANVTGNASGNMPGTIYTPPDAPTGRFRIIRSNGNQLTLSLIGTNRTYIFDTLTDTFGSSNIRPR